MKKAGDQPCLKYLTCDGFLNFSNDIFHSYIHLLTISCLEFNLAVFDSLTDCNTVWDTDQFHILELDTRSFITVIQNDFIAFASKLFIDALCFLNLLGILCGNDDDGNLMITAIEGGAINEGVTSLYLSYTMLDPASVTSEDIIGGVDTNTNKTKGLELIEEVYPRFGLVPGIIIAPGWSHDTGVAAVMKAKEHNICGHFNAISVCDIDTSTVKTYTKASEWKNKNNFADKDCILCWPMLTLAGKKYHISGQLASLMNYIDSQHDDIPYYSPSNKSLQADGACLADSTEVFLNNAQAAYLNGQGIVTAINFIGGWKAWGNRTTIYPSNTDVKDNFITNRRMFNWVGATLVTSFWAKIDEPANKRLINSIVDSANIWFNGLTAKGALLGGRVEFREDENTTTDLMDGKLYFHVFITPPAPARDIEFVQEYDPDYISTLFA